MNRLLGAACLAALAGCAAPLPAAPLGPETIRTRIVGRTFTGLAGKQRFFITFDRGGAVTYYGATAEFAQWHTGGAGLCIHWYGAKTDSCAPVYQVGTVSYRVGGITMTQFDLPRPF